MYFELIKNIILFFLNIFIIVKDYFLKKILNLSSVLGNGKLGTAIRIFLLKLLKIKCKNKIFIDYGFDCLVPNNIEFGKGISLGHYNKIWAFDRVVIGDYVQTAIGLSIIAGSHENDTFEPKKEQQIIIGNGCWIGANVTIMGNVTIGKGCIIGAGSLVNKNIADFTIAAGVPAKPISKRVPGQKVLHPYGVYDISELNK